MLPPKLNVDELKAQIKAVVLRESEDFFDDPEDLAVLQVTIRIACEFLDFLQRTDGSPELSQAVYMAGTIRAGMDEYVTLALWGRIISGLELRDRFDWNLPSSFPEMKTSYSVIFQQLTQSTSSAQGVGMLLSLAQMMLHFMTVYFPSL